MAVENQSDGFPVGMRVLAVDDDPISLKVLETFLRKCHYHVTTMNQSIEALRMLRENRNMFDLIISDVNMPEMDGFKLLELVEEYEMDLPVILLSAHSDAKLVMKGVTNGACDYLLKPVRIEELKNIWQHVLRRRTKIDSKDQNSNNVSGSSGEGGGQNIVEDRADHMKILGKRRKDQDGDNDDDEPSSSQKKPRVVWSVELHRKFLAAVNQLGLDKAVPKKIHQLMNVEGVTRENVSSHLQKYRLHLKKVTQQASMVSASSDGSDSLFRMGAIDRSGKIPNTTLPSYASGGIFGPLNSPACLNLGEISSSAALIRPVQSQNISSCSLSNIANIQPFMFPSYQSSNLLPGIPTSIELNQSESSGFAVASSFPNSNANSSSFPYVSTNSLMLQGNSQQTYNTSAFRNQSSAGTELFDTSICASSNYLLEYNSCTENWQTGAQLPKFPASSLQDCVNTFNNDYNSPADSSSSVVSVVPLGGARNELRCQEGLNANIVQPSSFTPRQSWEGHELDYNQSMSCGFNLETPLSSTPLMRWSQF